jgi:hypothetical protein
VLPAAAGSYTITGTAAALRRGLTSSAGSYTLTGSPATFVTTNNTILSASTGSYTIIGSPASLVPGTVVTAKLVTAYAPGVNRNDLTLLVGMEFALTVNTPFNGAGILCGANNTGIHAVELYDRTTETLLRSVNVDLTGKAAGTFYYANMTPITLVAGTKYALLTKMTAGDFQYWSDVGATTLKDSQPGSVFACYQYPLGSAFTTTAFADAQYVGLDLSYSVTVVDIPTRPAGGAGWGDVGRERRRKARGLRQAQKFFEDQTRESQEKIAVIAETAKAEAAEARKAGEHQRAQSILIASREQQQRQQKLIDDMLAQAAARVQAARVELAQVEALQRALEQDEEDAISVLLLH